LRVLQGIRPGGGAVDLDQRVISEGRIRPSFSRQTEAPRLCADHRKTI
jgi:hypothetical protein